MENGKIVEVMRKGKPEKGAIVKVWRGACDILFLDGKIEEYKEKDINVSTIRVCGR